MRTFLDRVRDQKLKEVRKRQEKISEHFLREEVEKFNNLPEFKNKLFRKSDEEISLVLEVKSKSPGRENVDSLDPEKVVFDYEVGGAKAISVLTDEYWFGGSLETLEKVHSVTTLPLLHKEFIISPYQLLEGRVRGSSAALILAYYFQELELSKIINEANKIGLETVVECSVEEELPRVIGLNPDILMINNRPIAKIPEDPTKQYDNGSINVISSWWESYNDLREWKKQPDKLLISASCVNSFKDIQSLSKIPCDAVLIGNAAMKAKDRVAFLHSLSKTKN